MVTDHPLMQHPGSEISLNTRSPFKCNEMQEKVDLAKKCISGPRNHIGLVAAVPKIPNWLPFPMALDQIPNYSKTSIGDWGKGFSKISDSDILSWDYE